MDLFEIIYLAETMHKANIAIMVIFLACIVFSIVAAGLFIEERGKVEKLIDKEEIEKSRIKQKRLLRYFQHFFMASIISLIIIISKILPFFLTFLKVFEKLFYQKSPYSYSAA